MFMVSKLTQKWETRDFWHWGPIEVWDEYRVRNDVTTSVYTCTRTHKCTSTVVVTSVLPRRGFGSDYWNSWSPKGHPRTFFRREFLFKMSYNHLQSTFFFSANLYKSFVLHFFQSNDCEKQKINLAWSLRGCITHNPERFPSAPCYPGLEQTSVLHRQGTL